MRISSSSSSSIVSHLGSEVDFPDLEKEKHEVKDFEFPDLQLWSGVEGTHGKR